MSGLLTDKINLNDFKKLKHQVVFRNDSSGTEVKDSSETRIVSLNKEEMKLLVPINCCVVGHSLTLFLLPSVKAGKIKTLPATGNLKGAVQVIGKVSEIDKREDDDNPKDWLITIAFTQFDKNEWEKLTNLYEERQEEINKLINDGKVP